MSKHTDWVVPFAKSIFWLTVGAIVGLGFGVLVGVWAWTDTTTPAGCTGNSVGCFIYDWQTLIAGALAFAGAAATVAAVRDQINQQKTHFEAAGRARDGRVQRDLKSLLTQVEYYRSAQASTHNLLQSASENPRAPVFNYFLRRGALRTPFPGIDRSTEIPIAIRTAGSRCNDNVEAATAAIKLLPRTFAPASHNREIVAILGGISSCSASFNLMEAAINAELDAIAQPD